MGASDLRESSRQRIPFPADDLSRNSSIRVNGVRIRPHSRSIRCHYRCSPRGDAFRPSSFTHLLLCSMTAFLMIGDGVCLRKLFGSRD